MVGFVYLDGVAEDDLGGGVGDAGGEGLGGGLGLGGVGAGDVQGSLELPGDEWGG